MWSEKLMNFWCACHRSDLSMEDMEESVPELKVLEVKSTFHPEILPQVCRQDERTEKSSPIMKAFLLTTMCGFFPAFKQCLYCCPS